MAGHLYFMWSMLGVLSNTILHQLNLE